MKFLLSNKIYLPISLFSLIALFYGAYFVEANFSSFEQKGRVLGISEEIEEVIGDRNFLPVAKDVDEDYWRSFFYTESFPQKMEDGIKPSLKSESHFVYSLSSDYVFTEHNSEKIMPIASITKLMTALVFLDINPGWENIYEIKREDRVEGGRIYLYLGDRVRVVDLFNLSLMASANTATMAMVNSTGYTEKEFIERMNKKANEIGLLNTNFVDPVGLSDFNTSSAKDLAVLLETVISHKEIKEVLQMAEYSFETAEGIYKIAYSTDGLLGIYPKNNISLIGGKTGFTNAAGYCFVGLFEDDKGRSVVSVVLGAGSISARFTETDEAVSWVYSNFVW